MLNLTVDPNSELPLYEQLKSKIRSSIAVGDLEPGDRLPSIREMCRETGLAYATVSRVTRSLVEEGVLSANAGAGTRVAEIQAPARPSTGCLGIASSESFAELRRHSPYFTRAFLAAQDEAVDASYIVSYDRWGADAPIDTLFRHGAAVDGLVVFNGGSKHLDLLQHLGDLPYPVVALGDSVNVDVPCVCSKNRDDVRRAVTQLIELGHERIAFAGGHAQRWVEQERYAGYCEGLSRAGIRIDPAYNIYADGASLARRLLTMPKRPTALLIAAGIDLFPSALPLLYNADIHVGRELYVAAYDDDYFGVLTDLHVPHMRLHQPVEELGKLAIRTLTRILETGTCDRTALTLPATIEIIGTPILPHSGDWSD